MQKHEKYSLAFLLIFATLNMFAENWQFKLDSNYNGPTISFQGCMFNSGTSFVCVEPSFRAQYFYLPKTPFKKQLTNTELTISNSSSEPFFMQNMNFEVTGERTMKISIDGQLTKDMDAAIEYIPLSIPAAFMDGAVVEADGKSLTVGDKDQLSTIGQPVKQITIKSKYGTISINVEQGGGLVMGDRRKNMYKGKEQFLLMLPALFRLNKKGETFKHVISIEIQGELKDFNQKVTLNSRRPESGSVKCLSAAKYQPSKKFERLYPEPKEIKFTGDTSAVPQIVKISSGEFGQKNNYAKLLSELFENMSINRQAKDTNGIGFINIHKTTAPTGNKYDYYELTVNDTGVSIASPTARGAYYALTTLVQLIDVNGRLRATEIKDWADFKFRGVHICADSASLKFHSAVIKQILAPLKFNHIVIECEYGKWPSHPEMHQSWGITPEDLKKLAGIATSHFMEVTPLFQTLGHSQYLFNNKSNLDIAENPEDPCVYNISNPRTYQVVSELLADMRQVLPSTEYLHIGHDEVTQKKYPCRPENMANTPLELFMKDLIFYQKYAANHNLKLMIWQDMLSGRNPDSNHIFNRVKKQLDKNITIVVWDYNTKNDYPEMDMFLKNGNPVICATGHDVGGADDEGSSNIMAFAKSAKKRQALGMLQTTWSGYTGNADVLTRCATQIWAYAQAGVSFWNANSPLVDYYNHSWIVATFDRILKKQYPQRYFFSGGEIMTPLNLSSIANAEFDADSGFAPGKLKTPYGVIFDLAGDNKNVAVTKVYDKSPVEIRIGRKAQAVSFLIAGLEHKNSTLGVISVKTDKGNIIQPIKAKMETGDLRHELSKSGRYLSRNSLTRYFIGRPVFSDNDKYVLWQYDLTVNDATLETIKISAKNDASLIIAGITIIEDDDSGSTNALPDTAVFKTSGFFGTPDNSKTLEQIDAEDKPYDGVFTWSEYKKLLSELSKPKYKVLPLREFNKDNSSDKVLVALRHDSDSHPLKALKMAEIEKTMGIKSTYFLLHSAKYYGKVKDGVIIRNEAIDELAQKLYNMGFEVGIHRDLFNMMWNYQFEPRAFMKAEIAYYKNIGIPVTGSAAHGDMTTINRKLNEMWIYSEFGKKGLSTVNGISYPYGEHKATEFGVDYEAYLLKYTAGTGDIGGNFSGRNLDELIKYLGTLKPGTRFGLLIHPEHWGRNSN
ncbi:MAG: glycoside hydrolase family 20 zincin-like fold domain-containing protein [Victivallaceae bacterium]